MGLREARWLFLYLMLVCRGWAEPLRFAIVVYSCTPQDEAEAEWVTLLSRTYPLLRPSCKQRVRIHKRVGNVGCAETHGYLQAVLDNYDSLEGLADILFFAHAHRTSWHYATPVDEQIERVMRDVDYLSGQVRTVHVNWPKLALGAERVVFGCVWATNAVFCVQDFGNVYCNSNRVLATSEWGPSVSRSPEELWSTMFRDTDIAFPFRDDASVAFQYPCCGTFWVKTASVLRRPRSVYERVLQNAFNTSEHDNKHVVCGRVAESAWHVMFADVNFVEKPEWC